MRHVESGATKSEKVFSLFVANGSSEPVEDLQHVFPNLAFLGRRLVSEQISGMIGNHQGRAVVRMPPAAQLPHGAACSKKAFNRDRAERDQDFWLNDVYLLHQIGPAGLHLNGRRWAITRRSARHVRPTFQNIGNINITTPEPHCLNYSGKQLTGAPNKWLALGIFIRARRLPDKHDVGIGATDAKHRLGAGAREMRAFLADTDALRD
jgi:hypothetical protein